MQAVKSNVVTSVFGPPSTRTIWAYSMALNACNIFIKYAHITSTPISLKRIVLQMPFSLYVHLQNYQLAKTVTTIFI